MDSAAVLRSTPCVFSRLVQSVLERPSILVVPNSTRPTSSKLHIQGLNFGGKIVASPTKQKGTVVSCVKASETTPTDKADDNHPQGSLEKTSLRGATFPSGFEELILKVCDETEIAELKVKVGDFEMHLKRSIGATKSSVPSISPTTPPPIPTKPMIESATTAPTPPPPKPSTEKVSPFKNVAVEKSAKLAALEASGSTGYVIVASPTVGSFRKGRTLKGKKQSPICKEGDVIKEGQVIGFLDQFGTELPVKSDVAGEVLKLLFEDGEAVGYGDPLIAVLPSFHGIE